MSRTATRNLAALAVALAVVLAGCGGSGAAPAGNSSPQLQHRQINFGGITRTYRVFAPSTLDRRRPAPLVLVLGGYKNSADTTAQLTHFDSEATIGRFVVAYPEGVGLSWNAGFCCGHVGYGVDDVGFLNHLMDQLEVDYRLDSSQVYAVGFSSGAFMAYRLACEDASRVAGVGSVAGSTILDTCHPAQKVSVIEVHGTVDPQVPYGGGDVMPPGTASQPIPSSTILAQGWAKMDGCSTTPTLRNRGPVTTTIWSSCQAATGVQLVAVTGGDHTWFAPQLGAIDGALDTTDTIWSFLNSHRRAS